jgi:hypothetical protein
MGEKGLESALYWLPWIKTAKFWAGVLVGIGILGEISGDRLAAPLEKVIDDAREVQVARLSKDAAEANLELAKLKTPRTLSSDQKRKIVASLRAFAGQKFSLAVGQDPEQFNLLEDIKSILLSAGWIKIPAVGFGDISLGDAAFAFGTGVVVRFSPNASADTQGVAIALASALQSEGIGSAPEADTRIPDALTLNVLVGSKPMR